MTAEYRNQTAGVAHHLVLTLVCLSNSLLDSRNQYDFFFHCEAVWNVLNRTGIHE